MMSALLKRDSLKVSCQTSFLEIGQAFLFCFTETATTEIYTLSLHDALPIYQREPETLRDPAFDLSLDRARVEGQIERSEEHTSELQSRENLVCRLLFETIQSLRPKRYRNGRRKMGWSGRSQEAIG